MRRSWWLWLVAGCAALDLNLPQDIAEVTVEGDPVAHAAGQPVRVDLVPPQVWETELPQEPAAIFLDRLELRITPAGEADGVDDFAFLESVVFYVDSPTEGSALPRHPLAWSEAPLSGREVSLVMNRALDLLPYVREGLRVSSEVKGVIPPTDATFAGRALLYVDAL